MPAIKTSCKGAQPPPLTVGQEVWVKAKIDWLGFDGEPLRLMIDHASLYAVRVNDETGNDEAVFVNVPLSALRRGEEQRNR